MADLIDDTRAKYNINQSSFTSDETTTIDALITALSKAVKRYCRREFDSQTFDELYSGQGDEKLILKQYPIITVARVAEGPRTVLEITNTSSSNQRATVAVTSTGLSLTRVASGTSSTDTSVTWAGNATLNAVASAVNALGNGWVARVSDSNYGLWASADLKTIQGALNARSVYAPLKIHVDEVADYEVDQERGWLLKGHSLSATSPYAWNTSGWVEGLNNYRVIYTAGYATVPEDVQEACAQWVASLFWQTKDNPASYPDQPGSSVALILNHYRKHRI